MNMEERPAISDLQIVSRLDKLGTYLGVDSGPKADSPLKSIYTMF